MEPNKTYFRVEGYMKCLQEDDKGEMTIPGEHVLCRVDLANPELARQEFERISKNYAKQYTWNIAGQEFKSEVEMGVRLFRVEEFYAGPTETAADKTRVTDLGSIIETPISVEDLPK